MLQNIRDRAQGWLAWIIVVMIAIPFALWGIEEYIHPKQRLIVAEVNDTELSQTEFENNVRQQKRQLSAMFKQNIDSSMDKQIKQNVLNRMIEEELLVQSAKNAGLRVGDGLLAAHIHDIEAFRQNGIFSQDYYEFALRNAGLTPTAFEEQMRREILTDQLREGIVRSALVTPLDQQTRTRLEEQERAISYVLIPTSRFMDSVTISDAEVEEYYNKNTTQYMTPEKVSVEYVELAQNNLSSTEAIDEDVLEQYYQEHIANYTTPTKWRARHILIAADDKPEQVEAIQKKAQEILAKAKAGEPFDALAKQFSEDKISAEKGGDLGEFEAGVMVKPFEEALVKLKPNEISDLVKSQFGFHIIQLLDTKPSIVRSFAEVRDELQKTLQKERTEKAFNDQVDRFATLAFETPNTLDVVVQTLSLSKKTSELFDRTGIANDKVLSNPKVIEAAFGNNVLKDGNNSEVIDLGNQHMVVLRVKDHEIAKLKPLADVKEFVIKTLRQQKAKEAAQNLGKSLLEQVKQNADPNAIVQDQQLNWTPKQWVKRHDTTLNQPKIVQEVFKMGKPSENSALYQGIVLDSGDYALVTLLAVKEGEVPAPSTDAKEGKKPDPSEQAITRQQLALGDSDFKQLVSGLKAIAKIKKYEDKIHGDSGK